MTLITVHILDVGQGSCAVILAGDRVSVIDGGTTRAARERTDPVAWLRGRGITAIHDLILTHLHRDHAQGLLALAREFPVGRAFLPYPRLTPPRRPARAYGEVDADVDSPAGQYQLITEYRDLLSLLEEAGTPVSGLGFSAEDNPVLWGEGAAVLERVYPLPGDRPVTPALVDALPLAQSEERILSVLDELSETTNAESAVFILRLPGEPAVVFAGDHSGPGSAWERIGARTDLAGAIWVLPHHGRPDGPPPAFYRARSPRALIASLAASRAAECGSYWEDLAEDTGCEVMTTAQPRPRVAWRGGGLEVRVDAATG
ncbi:ComEC/Rec2 family competence protein [Mycetocola spongiae]|uniref:ComEC/Rec2 family competence protein n=1 Tax=Mycetocola spongiae TaxID=2859226 RepID=UPI001CF36D3E|nr:MBL fold metallo-hydrolase [Mycetocola spongiae]UCR89640.1 MBL fold metallo-hydrolase [Mycetocola spongiae]